jgi:hypothetical protein
MSISVDIVILNYNTRSLLEDLLPKVIENSQGENVKIVVADNHSSDGSAAFVASNYPDIELIRISENLGYAGGYNYCLKNRKSDYFVLLNSDAEPAPGWIAALIDLAKRNPKLGAAQPHILDYNNRHKFEYAGAAGGFMDRYGYPFCRGRIFGNVEINNGQYDDEMPLFWATGAALFIKREAWEKAGGLDELFFAHMEEIDLCWRLKNMGYEIWSCPNSKVYHIGGATLSNQSPRKTYLNFRNNLLMLYKNLEEQERDAIIFKRKLLDGLAACFFILQGKINHIPQIIKAHRDFEKLKLQLKCGEGNKKLTEHSGVLHAGLVSAFFLKGKKTWNKLGF